MKEVLNEDFSFARIGFSGCPTVSVDELQGIEDACYRSFSLVRTELCLYDDASYVRALSRWLGGMDWRGHWYCCVCFFDIICHDVSSLTGEQMSNFQYLRMNAVRQFPTWIVAAAMIVLVDSVYGGGFRLVSSGDILLAVIASFVAVLMMAPSQLMYPQGYLSRLVWVVVSATAVWIAYDIYPFYTEAVVHDMVMEHNGKFDLVHYKPAEMPQWYGVAIGTYILFSVLLVANLGWSLYIAVGNLFWEIKNGIREINGIDGITTDSLGVSLCDDALKDMFKSKPAVATPQRTDLATRDTEALPAKLTFDDLSGQEELKEKLWDAAQTWNNNGMKNGKNGIFLYGQPGTGKTAFAEALAGEVGLKFMKVNIGSMASRWINQTTEQLQDIIDSALRQAPCVLFFDEVEAILPDRSLIGRGDAEESKVVASFLSSIDKLRDGRVLVVAATNYIDRVDKAATREGRFDFHIEVTVPDFEARKGLVLNALKKTGKTVDLVVLDRLAARWGGFNIPRIQEATRRAAAFAKTNVVGMADFMRGLREVQGNKTGVPETALSLDQLYFDDDVMDRLKKLAMTFAKSDEIEARGGTVPNGVVFYGPPGTGKSTMAMALAKASGWAFIPTTGKEILSEAKALEKIRSNASDLRPAIVFIDEADDILGDRRMSGMKLHTNDLLATIDGAGGPLPDVVWIIATNDIDSLDEAVTRRFPVKIELNVPGIEALVRMVRDWANKRPDMIPGGVEQWSRQVAAALEGLSPSVVKGILESALNNEAANSVMRGEDMRITLDDVLQARREMRA
jgi:transitional endoplasmic reticulum ATPase